MTQNYAANDAFPKAPELFPDTLTHGLHIFKPRVAPGDMDFQAISRVVIDPAEHGDLAITGSEAGGGVDAPNLVGTPSQDCSLVPLRREGCGCRRTGVRGRARPTASSRGRFPSLSGCGLW